MARHGGLGEWCGSLLIALCLSACGTVTGVPSHGGGKRFAVEQELISASARGALRAINLAPLAGRSVRVVFASIGDEGSGNLTGGRLSLDRVLSAAYSSGAVTRTDIAGGLSQQAVRGVASAAGLGLNSDGATSYRSEAFINPRDTDFLSSLVTGHLLMAGAQIKGNPALPAEALVIVLVDVFGTIRDRTDFLVYNRERLRARTALEIVVVRQSDGTVVLPAQRGAAEAEWSEDYVLWSGPTGTRRSLHRVDDLLMPDLPSQPAVAVRAIRDLPAQTPQSLATPSPPRRPRADSQLEVVRDRPNLLPKPDTKPRTAPPFR